MSTLGSFKLPSLTKKRRVDHGLPTFNWSLVNDVQEIGSGSYGSIHCAIYNEKTVVIKKLKGESSIAKDRFLKEAKLLFDINHAGIPRFLGFSEDPYSLMIEYIMFDFQPFGIQKTVTNIGEFYHFIDHEFDFESFADVLVVCIRDVVNALDYLHKHNIAHRDLKPENVLVSNQHYCQENQNTVALIYANCPIVCKVTDFGFSRSSMAQTRSILQSCTDDVYRGTAAYMAPEIHKSTLINASLEDLKKTDIWSLGILAYAVINPNLVNPYHKETEALGGPLTMEAMKMFMQGQQLPTHDTKYEALRVTEWWQIEEIFEMCTKFEPSCRPKISEILQFSNLQLDPSKSLIIKCLNVSQSTAIENKDCEVALRIHAASHNIGGDLSEDQNIVENDATNACVFLALRVCDIFLQNMREDRSLTWDDVVGMAEETITTFPVKINALRDVAETYDVSNAKDILTSNSLLNVDYELSEECTSGDGVFTELGRKELFNALLSKKNSAEQANRVGLYTCSPYTFLVGTNSSSYFLIDTHPISEDLGGNGNGILVATSDTSERSCKLFIQWILKRLRSSGVNGSNAQSFAWLIETHFVQGVTNDQDALDEPIIEKDTEQSENFSNICDTIENELQSPEIPELSEGGISTPTDIQTSRTPTISVSSDSDDSCEISLVPIDKSAKKRNIGEFYNGNTSLPVFDWKPMNKTTSEIMKILLRPIAENVTCKVPPHNISHNVSFLLDTSGLESKNDWKSDDMGAWKNNKVQRIQLDIEPGGDVIPVDNSHEGYTLKRVYYKNKSSPDLRKIVSFLPDHPNLIFFQYMFDGIEHPVSPAPHGNNKRPHNPAYTRTKESTTNKLRDASTTHTPKAAYHVVHKEKGGILNASALSDLPRNRDQAKYARRGHTTTTNFEHIDSLAILLEQCKRQQINRDELPFVREVTGAPELRCILGLDWQLQDLATFCNDPEEFTIFGADPTFNLGRFNVTVTSYRNLKVLDRTTGKHPTMIGPMLISQTKSFDAYNHFFSKIISLNKDTRGILAFGADGEEELYKAMRFSFPHAIHLRCFMHFRDNCKEQLKSSNVPEVAQKEFLADIFGRRVGDTLERGLLDADDPDDFRARLSSVKDDWDQREQKYLPRGTEPKFHDYILNREEMLVQCMLKEVRRHAGLGDPPAPFYNNVPESANAMIKRAVSFKENEMNKFCQEMNVLLLRQKEDVESAIINHGPYRLAPKFSSLELSPDQWFKKNSQQKQAYVKKFHNAKMSALSVDSSSPRPSTSQESPQTQEIEISTDLTSLGITSANPVTLQNVSAKAKVLLNEVGAIVEAPTSTGEQAYMVKSETMVRPHYVSISKNGKVTCADCPGWNAFKICSHSLAVAEKTGKTADYVKWLLKKGPQRPNLTNLMTCDSPKGVGKKQQKTATARRKGHRSANNAPPTTVVDRLPLRPTSTSNFSTNQHVSGPPIQQHQPTHLQCQAQPSIQQAQPTHQQSQPLHHFPHQQPLNSAPPSMVYQIYSNSPQTIHVDLLQLCSPLVRTCFGCSQSLKPQGAIAAAPCDLVLRTKMYRDWPDKNTGEMRHSFQNVYFHVNVRCVQMKQPYFRPQMVILSDAVAAHLTPVHYHFLRDFGMSL